MRIADLLTAGVWDDEFDRAVDTADADDIVAVLALIADPASEARLAALQTLPFLTHGEEPTAAMVAGAVQASDDSDPEIRDWACFALGQQWREVDTDEVREALARRLDDEDPDARCEALLGLAYRRDPRAVKAVRAALERSGEALYRLELVAAGALSDPQLHERVLDHQSGWDDDHDLVPLADVVRRLTDPAGVGSDVIAGVAKLYRDQAHGKPVDDAALRAWKRMESMLEIAPWRAPDLLEQVAEGLDGDDAAIRQLRERSALAQLAAG